MKKIKVPAFKRDDLPPGKYVLPQPKKAKRASSKKDPFTERIIESAGLLLTGK